MLTHARRSSLHGTWEGDVTLLLNEMAKGNAGAAEKLLPLVYAELHRLAASYMRRERADHTLARTHV